MKLVYSLLLVMTAAAVNVSAQRNVDLSVRRFLELSTAMPNLSDEVKNGTHILFDGSLQYKINIGYIIRNSATAPKDSVTKADTVKIKATIGPSVLHNIADVGLYIPAGNQYGLLIPSSYPKAIAPGQAFNTSGAISAQYCDSIWIVSPVGATNPAIEANPGDDTVCNSVIVDAWATGINDVDVDAEGNGLLVHPNPAVSRDINIMYNFGANTSKAVVTIMDVTGKVVYSKNIGTSLSGTQSISLQIGDMAPGMYSVRLATDDKTTIEKILVK
jgi:hypothetical protein